MAAHSGSGFDLTPPSLEQRKLLEEDLTAEEANVLLRHATEAPFCGAFLDEKRSGVFTCRLCGLPLFLGGQKFESGTGWPSFTAPFDDDHLREERDSSYGMARRSFSAPAAAATRGTCSPTARRPRACATASTPCLWTLRPRASRCPTSSAVVPRRASPGKGDRLRGGLRSTPCMPRRATHLESLEARASPASER